MIVKRTIRSLIRTPAFTVTTVLSLGFALAVSATLVGITESLLHPPVPYSEPSRVFSASLYGGDARNQAPPDVKERTLIDALDPVASSATFLSYASVVSVGLSGEETSVTAASPNLFSVLGVQPITGRSFATDDGSDEGRVALISYALWNRLFSARPVALGERIELGSSSFVVIGVLPRGVHFPFVSDVWIPLNAAATDTGVQKGARTIVFRLKTGETIPAAEQRLALGATQLAEQYGRSSPYAVRLTPLTTKVWLPWIPKYVFAVVGLVLAIAAANLGTMMLARGMTRRRETAIRIALGASRWAVVKDVLAECAMVIVGGTSIGLVATILALHAVPTARLPIGRELVDLPSTPNVTVFVFAALVAASILLVAGLAPAIRAASIDPAEPIKEGGGLTRKTRDRYGSLLILEIALSTGLLLSSALFALYARNLAAFDFTYDAKALLTAEVSLTADALRPGMDVGRAYDDLLVRMTSLQGARSAATRSFEHPVHAAITSEDGTGGTHRMIVSKFAVVSPTYLRTVGISVVAGRDFVSGDRDSEDGTVIVDEHAAHILWPYGSNAVGHLIKLGTEDSSKPWLRVIGVARWTELDPRVDVDVPPEPQIYVVYKHDTTRDREVIIRSARGGGDGLTELVGPARRELQAFAPRMMSPRVRPWLEDYNSRLEVTIVLASALALFGLLGLVLCAIGLYGSLAYSVTSRRREFGVRIALGARPSAVVQLIAHDNVVTILAGVALGAGAALFLVRRLGDPLIGAQFELVTALLIAEALLFLAGVTACVGPLRRAARTDPVDALRTG